MYYKKSLITIKKYRITDEITKIDENESKNFERAEKKAQKFINAEVLTVLNKDNIKGAWEHMECIPPWSVWKFLKQMSIYNDDEHFELIDIGNFLFE